MVFGFLRGVTEALKEGKRAGEIVRLIQKVIVRPLSRAEQNAFKNFYDAMSFDELTKDSEIVVDYFYFLLGDGDHPSRLKSPNMTNAAKERLIECMRGALGWGYIPQDKGLIDDLREHAGLSKAKKTI